MYQWFSSETHSYTTCWTLFLGMGLTCPPPCHSLGHRAQRVFSASQEPGNLGYQVALWVVYVWVCEGRRGERKSERKEGEGKAREKRHQGIYCLGYCSSFERWYTLYNGMVIWTVKVQDLGRRSYLREIHSRVGEEIIPERDSFSSMMIENPKSETFTLRFLSNRMFSGWKWKDKNTCHLPRGLLQTSELQHGRFYSEQVYWSVQEYQNL